MNVFVVKQALQLSLKAEVLTQDREAAPPPNSRDMATLNIRSKNCDISRLDSGPKQNSGRLHIVFKIVLTHD